MHVWFIGIKEHFGEIAGKNNVRPLFLLPGFFCLVARFRSWGFMFWHLWIGRAQHPGPAPPSQQVGLEVFNVGKWLTHGDLALEARVDFLAVVEHRLYLPEFEVSGPGSRVRGWPLSPLQPARIPPMLVVLGLVLLA